MLTSVSAGLAALIFSTQITPVFEAKTTFYLAANLAPLSYVGPLPDAPPTPLFPVPEEKAASLDVGILRGREVRSRLAERFATTVGEIEKRVDVTVSGEFMIDVFVRNTDPARAAEIANAVPEVYADFHQRSMRDRATAAADALTKRLAELAHERDRQRAVLRDTRSGSLSTADSTALDRLQTARDAARMEIDNLAAQIRQSEARRGSLDATLLREAGYYAQAQTIDTTSSLDRMLERLLDLRVDLAAVTDGPSGPRRVAIEGQISEIEAAMAVEKRRLAEATAKPWGSLYEELRLELALTRATIAGLEAARSAAASRIVSATDRFSEVLAAVSSADDANVALAGIDRQIAVANENLAAARLQSENATPALVIVERAIDPTRPAFPLPLLNTIVAALCGLIFGTYYALFVAHSERAAQVRRSRIATLPVFTADELALIGDRLPLFQSKAAKRPDNA